jgi:hypothetical protein|tara:strand:+ start:916 stop:1206 length:291 start_codon:yes stop_codon:yes gene_type:complete
MVSLKDIYNVKESTFIRLTEDQDFTTKQTSTNPETGQVSWDVDYKTDFNRTYREIDEAVKRLQDLVGQEKDPEARELLIMAKNLRNKFARYKRKKS